MITDPLTGVYSRATLEQRLHEEVDRAVRYNLPFSIILLDLDHYKSVNDAFGHLRGDQVLVELVARVQGMVRKADIIYRYGGDEFLILLPHTDKSQAVILAERLQEGVRAEPFSGRPPVTVSLSLGVASVHEDGETAEVLFEKADQRHYEAKRRGRARVIANDSGLQPILPFEDEARLIERDQALVTLHHFLRELPQVKRGLFIVSGTYGSGRTRFLSEVGKVARLQGYEVIPLRGSSGLKNRSFGDLNEVVKNWPTLPQPTIGPDEFGAALYQLVVEKGRSGLLFTVDNLLETDWDTQDLLRHLMLSSQPPIPLALSFSSDPSSARRIFPPLSTLEKVVEMPPLSLPGFSIWLRTLLRWEAPDQFKTWLHEETRGLPGFVQRALHHLLDRGLLQRAEYGWIFTGDLSSLSLKDSLGIPQHPPPNNMPAALTGFLGREEEIEKAKKLLNSERLVSIIGPGGIGKTRLAIQIGAEVIDRFPDGVYWTPLAAVPTVDRIISAIGDAVGLTFQLRPDPKIQLFTFLRDKCLLLFLDNFEHLTEGSAIISELLEHARNIQVLVTTRERLNLRGEAVLPLSGMGFPASIPAERIETYPAIQLFMQSARRAYPGFALKEENKAAIVEICQIMEGLPLGIELAAAWIKILTCDEIVREIKNNLDFLAAPLRSMPQRHSSLRAVFEHSWELLLDDEKKALRQMSVFAGSFNREAAEEVTGAGLLELALLLDKSLLRRVSQNRFEMHDILRQYAHEKLLANPEEAEQTHRGHAEYYARLLREREPHLLDSRMTEALQRIGQEIQNLLKAWRWAIAHKRPDLIDDLLESLFRFHKIRGFIEDQANLLLQAEQMLSALPEPPAEYMPLYRKWLARLQIHRSELALHQSQYDLARDNIQTSLAAFRDLGERKEEAFALFQFASLESETGNYEQALALALEAQEIFRSLDDRNGSAIVLNLLGIIAYDQGEYQRSEQHHQASMHLFRELDHRWGLASTLINLGNVESEMGDYQQARSLYQEAMQICEEVGAISGLATALNNLGDVERELGDYMNARKYLLHGLQIYQKTGEVYGRAIALCNLGIVAFRLGSYEEAFSLFKESLAISDGAGIRLQSAYTLTQLGSVLKAQGDAAAAAQYYHGALRLALINQTLPLLLETLVAYASLKQMTGEHVLGLELALLAANHPATMKSDREAALALTAVLGQKLGPEAVEACLRKNKSTTIENMINEILGDICPSTP